MTRRPRVYPAVHISLLIMLIVSMVAVAQSGQHVATAGPGLSLSAGFSVTETPSAAQASPEPVATPEATGIDPAWAGFAVEIEQILPENLGVYGVVVVDPDDELIYSTNATVPFISASLYKLPLMANIYRLVEQGAVSLSTELYLDPVYWSEGDDSYYDWSWMEMTTTVEEALFAAGAYSSNVAAWALATLTTWADVEATALDIGMTNTHMYVDPYALTAWPPLGGASDSPLSLLEATTFIESMAAWGPVMLTTPEDIATFFSRLLDGAVVSAHASAAILDILTQQAIDDRFPQLLPAGTTLAHKTGNLDQVVHDAGIIYTSSGPVILAALVESSLDDAVATGVIQQLARVVYDKFRSPVRRDYLTP